jgi:hypothetical protein
LGCTSLNNLGHSVVEEAWEPAPKSTHSLVKVEDFVDLAGSNQDSLVGRGLHGRQSLRSTVTAASVLESKFGAQRPARVDTVKC